MAVNGSALSLTAVHLRCIQLDVCIIRTVRILHSRNNCQPKESLKALTIR